MISVFMPAKGLASAKTSGSASGGKQKSLIFFTFLASCLLLLGLGQAVSAATVCPSAQCKSSSADCTNGLDDTGMLCGVTTNVCCKAATVTPPTPPAGTDTCTTNYPGFSCVDATGRNDCHAGECLSQLNAVKCCPPKAGTTPPTGGGGGGNTITIPLGPLSPIGQNTTIPQLIGYIIQGALGIIGSIALLMFVYGGIMMLTSQGDSAKIKKGKDTMVWASIGLIVIFGSYIFVSYIVRALSGTGGTGTSPTPTTPTSLQP